VRAALPGNTIVGLGVFKVRSPSPAFLAVVREVLAAHKSN
jgi:hypothetical protein